MNKKGASGIEARNRGYLDLLNKQWKRPFTPEEARKSFGLSEAKTNRLLAHLTTGGWLKRVRRGLYVTVPLGTNPAQRSEDSWVVAATVFQPCYIGGWSACEHWGFTEQIFNDVLVLATKKPRRKNIRLENIQFRVQHIPERLLFGTRTVWREQTRVQVSDPTKTIVDLVDNPALGGGMRHVSQVVLSYFSGEHRNDGLLISYLEKQGNGAAYKRLGFLVEKLGVKAPEVAAACRKHVTKGYSLLDPSIKAGGYYLERWNLKVNATVAGKDAA